MQPNRRDFLRFSMGASALTCFGPIRLPAAAGGRSATSDTILVVVQLSGGNDGLNSVVPFTNDEYYRKRPTIGLPADQLHRIDDQLGFHPNLKELKRLFDDGRLSIVQGVGYPQPSGDHDVSMRNWQTAQPSQTGCQTGWLGRVVDSVDVPESPAVPAVFVGQTRQPLTLNAANTVVPALRTLDTWILDDASQGQGDDRQPSCLSELAAYAGADPHPLWQLVQRNTSVACTVSARIQSVVDRRTEDSTVQYPAFGLARSLDMVAQLIRADLGIRIFCTELGGDGFGGFDSHANQIGNHCALLRQLSESLAAFVDDLQRDGSLDRVLLMTFSEFGRTIAENGRRGTDHGSAAPLFLAGGRLKGGLIGDHPKLTESENGGLKFHTDFRRLYATVLDNWLGFDSQACLGEQFVTLDVLQS